MRRRRGAMLSFAFFFGVVLSLLALGTAAAYLGRVLAQWSAAFALGAAIFSIMAGLAALFGPTLRRHIPDPEVTKRGSMAGAFVCGAAAVMDPWPNTEVDTRDITTLGYTYV